MKVLPERLPARWRSAALKELLREPIVNGRSVPTRVDGFPVLRLTAIKANSIDLDEHKNGDWNEDQAKPHLVASGDFLVSRGSGSIDLVGRGAPVLHSSPRVAFPDTMIRVRVNPEEISPGYLNRIWESSIVRDQIRNAARTTSGIYKINQQVLENILLPIPPLREQCRISDTLDALDALRVKRRKAVALLGDLAQSVFLDMFGEICGSDSNWSSGDVSEIVADFESGKSFSAGSEDESQVRYRILKVSAVTTGQFLPTESKPVPITYDPPKSHIVRDGDLLFSRANTESLIGATALVSSPPINLILSDKIWRFVWRDDSTAAPYFVRQLFRQDQFRREIARRSSGTSGSMKNISQAKVMSIRCGVPPVELRRAYDDRARVIESVQAVHCAHLAELDALFKSLQHRAFRGMLWDVPAV